MGKPTVASKGAAYWAAQLAKIQQIKLAAAAAAAVA